MSFKDIHSFEKRNTESTRIRAKYPEKIPVIIERRKGDKSVPLIDRSKFLVPLELSVGQFMYIIRKRLLLKPEQGIFVFFDNYIPPLHVVMSELYKDKKDKDGYLYASYSGESIFG